MTKILLSYRRADTGPIAGRIFDRLVERFGHDSVFMDIDDIPLGVDFREHIREELSQCDALIVIIGPRWLGARDDGTVRIKEEADPVRVEVETALQNQTPIIPVLVDRAIMPQPADLPESLRDFSFRNAAEVDAAGRDFRMHMDRVIRAVEHLLERKAKSASRPDQTIRPGQVPAAGVPAQTGLPTARDRQFASGFKNSWTLGIALGLIAIVGLVATYTTYTARAPDPSVADSASKPPVQSPPAAPPVRVALDFPARPLRMVIAFAAGGPTDVATRIVAESLSKISGQHVVVENILGDGGIRGTREAIAAQADGYTMGVTTNVTLLNGYLLRKSPIDPVRDVAPIAMIGRAPQVLVVHPSLPARSLKELVDHVRRNPGQIAYGSSGVLTLDHVGLIQLSSVAGLALRHVPSRGTGPALADLMAGKVQMMQAPASAVIPHIKTGRLRGVAVVAPERLDALRDIPTSREAGFPGYDVDLWLMIVAPSGTPEPVAERISGLVREATADPATHARLVGISVRPAPMTREQLSGMVARQLLSLARLAKEAGITVD